MSYKKLKYENEINSSKKFIYFLTVFLKNYVTILKKNRIIVYMKKK